MVLHFRARQASDPVALVTAAAGGDASARVPAPLRSVLSQTSSRGCERDAGSACSANLVVVVVVVQTMVRRCSLIIRVCCPFDNACTTEEAVLDHWSWSRRHSGAVF